MTASRKIVAEEDGPAPIAAECADLITAACARARPAGRAPKAEPGGGRAAAPLCGAALIMYGLIRQRPCSEPESEVGEAGDGASGSGSGEAFAGAGCGRVADRLGSGAAGGADSGR